MKHTVFFERSSEQDTKWCQAPSWRADARSNNIGIRALLEHKYGGVT